MPEFGDFERPQPEIGCRLGGKPARRWGSRKRSPMPVPGDFERPQPEIGCRLGGKTCSKMGFEKRSPMPEPEILKDHSPKSAVAWAENLLENGESAYEVQCRSLEILKDHSPKSAVVWAENLLENGESAYEVQCRSLEILKDYNPKSAVVWAENLLENGVREKEVQCRCLEILKDHNPKSAVVWAENLLENGVREKEVQCRCLEILGQVAAPFAEKILENWEKEDGAVLRRALKILETSPKTNRIVATIFKNRNNKRLYFLMIRGTLLKTPSWVAYTSNKAKNWNFVNRRDAVICMGHYPPDTAFVIQACQEILDNWHTEIANPGFNYHILKALSNPFQRDLARQRAGEMHRFLQTNPFAGDAIFKKVIEDIVDRNEWQEWKLSDEEMEESE
ncbi:MAG: hypothetical protein IPM36_15525 [Lewinellaceae bacterium]|nr:hypothetical protein [Lewinellaceae bacterium]